MLEEEPSRRSEVLPERGDPHGIRRGDSGDRSLGRQDKPARLARSHEIHQWRPGDLRVVHHVQRAPGHLGCRTRKQQPAGQERIATGSEAACDQRDMARRARANHRGQQAGVARPALAVAGQAQPLPHGIGQERIDRAALGHQSLVHARDHQVFGIIGHEFEPTHQFDFITA